MKKAIPKFIHFYKSNYAILPLCFILSFSCAPKKALLNEDAVLAPNPKLVFLNYSLSEDTSGLYKIQFISKKITDGTFRNNSSKYLKSGTMGDLICIQLDKNKTPITKQIIKNPLLKSIEYINDSSQFETKQIKTKKSSLALRFQLKQACKSITISQIIDSLQNTTPLITTKIN